jgi:intracellular multiplication protein IcmE
VNAKYLIKLFSCKQLKDGGYSARALQEDAGYNAKQLKELGFPATKLRVGPMWFDSYKGEFVRGAWFSAKELKEAGFSPVELKEARISAKKMKDTGFFREELEWVFTSWHLSKVFA